jgi:hypothetical protein
VSSPFIWERKQIQFPKRCVFSFLEYRTMLKVQEPSNSVCCTPSSDPFRIYFYVFIFCCVGCNTDLILTNCPSFFRSTPAPCAVCPLTLIGHACCWRIFHLRIYIGHECDRIVFVYLRVCFVSETASITFAARDLHCQGIYIWVLPFDINPTLGSVWDLNGTCAFISAITVENSTERPIIWYYSMQIRC